LGIAATKEKENNNRKELKTGGVKLISHNLQIYSKILANNGYGCI
jgi:hypothetical protein